VRIKKPSVSIAKWYERIQASRRRRQQWERLWAHYARLHTNAYRAVKEDNDDQLVDLPNGDQVKLGLIHRNIEQTMGFLEMPEIGVRAEATDYTRELGAEDTHREAIVEQALFLSMNRSGMVSGPEHVDFIKRDGIIIGHGANYTSWRIEEEEVELPSVQVLEEVEAGVYQPVIDPETGQPEFESITGREVSWEGCQDTHISPLEFLFDANARQISASPWHGMEKVVNLDELRSDPRFDVPKDIEGRGFRVRDIYGDLPNTEYLENNAVKVITIYDKIHRELLTFIEAAPPEAGMSPGETRQPQNKPPKEALIPIGLFRYPVKFAHPDDSPFTVFTPIPANDHPFGISQIEHTRNQAVEADKLRTRGANLTRQLKTLLAYNSNRITPDEVRAALDNPEGEPLGFALQDSEKLSEMFEEVSLGTPVHKELYEQIREAMNDITETSGVPGAPFTGADTATESDNQMSIGGARANRKRRLLLQFLSQVASRHRDFLAAFAPEGKTIAVTAPDGTPLTLEYGRAAFRGEFLITVLPSGGAMTTSPAEQKLMAEVTKMFMGHFGPQFDLVMLRQVLTALDIRDINTLLKAARMGMGLAGQAGGAPGGQPVLPGGTPPALSNPNNASTPQAIRAGINVQNEGGLS